MNLFDQTELFDTGKRQFRDFHLPDTELQLWEQFFPRAESDRYFKLLRDTSPWEQRMRKMYDRMVPDPRLTAYYGGPNGLEWTDDLLAIRARVQEECGIDFNRVLLNYYRDGKDSVAWHGDTLPADGKHYPIASVTFGDTRVFKVRHKSRAHLGQLDIPLTHGSFLLMGATMQDHYEHHVPKTAKKVGPRINLTFRLSDSKKPIYFRPLHQGARSTIVLHLRIFRRNSSLLPNHIA